MKVKVYVIRRTTIDEIVSYQTYDKCWVPSCMFEEIHFFTKKSTATEHMLKPIFPDVIDIHVVTLEMD